MRFRPGPAVLAPLVALAAILTGCQVRTEPGGSAALPREPSGAAAPETGSARARPGAAADHAAPWSRPALAADRVPPVYLTEWKQAENRSVCALLAPASLGITRDATPRRATFSGGWAVAYDFPDLRSAFGIAGTGARAATPSYAGFPYHREWSDGSSVDYGLEGGAGPNQLAYVRVHGQECLYNVWSRLGRSHLEFLIAQLRFVATAP